MSDTEMFSIGKRLRRLTKAGTGKGKGGGMEKIIIGG